ncbi:MAG: hypothetical protein JXA37_13840, partial [Chloroflexia bacterium]|nr:hypothetical protein [Chloroflexia bacterium]
PMTRESIAFLSYTPLPDAIRLLGSFSAWPYVAFEPPTPWLALPWTLASWAIPLVGLFALFRFRRHWQAWALFVLALVGVLLAKGVAPPLGGLYESLVFELMPGSFRWLFRVASKWNVFVSLGACGLVGLALGELLSRMGTGRPTWSRLRADRRSGGALLILGGYITALALFAWPSFSGDFGGALQPTPLPLAITAANRWLAQREGDFKVNWMPVTNGRELDWNRRPSGDLYTSLSSRPSIGTNWNQHPVLYYSYIYESLADGQMAYLGKLLAMLNTRFLAYHNDVVSGHVHQEVEPVSVLIEGQEASLIEQLAAQQDLRLVWQDDFISLYETRDFAPPLFVPQRTFWTAGDLSLLSFLDALVEFQPFQEAVLFDASRIEGSFPLAVDGLLLGHDAIDHVDMALLPVERLLAPAEATDRNDVTAAWSRFDVYQFDWQSLLRTHDIDYWGFDYGRGVVAHSTEVQLYGLPASAAAPAQLELEVDVPTAGTYLLWIRYLRQERGGEMRVSLDGRPLALLQGEDTITRFVWQEIGPLRLSQGRHPLQLENRDGLTVVNTLALISEQEMAALRARRRDLLEQVPQIYWFELEKDFVGPVEPLPDMTRFSSGRAVSLDAGETASTTLELLTPADYWLALRAYIPPAAAPLSVTLGTSLLSIPPPTDTADLAWLVVGPVRLQAGRLPLQLQTEDEVVLDALMLYTGESPLGTPEALFGPLPPPAEISYEQVDPTRYRVFVRAQRPFVLALAETYDPLWVASTADVQVSSLPLGGTINGFFIDKTGSYEIVVEYLPQQWARLGRLLSLLALTLAVPLALFLQRRRRNAS